MWPSNIYYIFKKQDIKRGVTGMIGCFVIHGYTGGPYEIDPLITYLKAETNWKIVVPVLEGHGRELELTNVAYEVWLEDTEKALEALIEQCEKVYVIGFSMGGMIASYLAATHEVDKLVLLAPARKYVSFKYLAKSVREMIGDGFKGKLDENDLYVNAKNKLGEVPLKANIEFMKLVHHTKPFLQNIRVPTFIVQGKRDEIVPFRSAHALEKEIGSKEKQVVIFEQSGHLICLGKDSDMLNRLVYAFLKK